MTCVRACVCVCPPVCVRPSPRPVAVFLPGVAVGGGPLAAGPAPRGPLAPSLHHLALVQGVVQPVVDRLQQQEGGADDAAVDPHDHPGGRQGLWGQEPHVSVCVCVCVCVCPNPKVSPD